MANELTTCREFDLLETNPTLAVVETVSDLEDVPPTELPALWPETGEVIEDL